MALNKPFGLSPINTSQGANFNSNARRYYIPSTDGSQYSIGDVVSQATSADVNGVPTVQKTATAGVQRGVIIGVENPSWNTPSLQGVVLDQTTTGIPATKTRAYYVYVVDDPFANFIVQDDGITLGTLVAASASKNCNLTIANPANNFQMSGTVILSATINTTSTFSYKLFGLAQYPSLPGGSPNTFGSYAIWITQANLHELLKGAPGAVGI